MKYLLSLFILIPLFLTAQIKRCGTGEVTQEIWKEHPELKAEFLQHQENFRQLLQSNVINKDGSNDSVTYIIPIVFHILHQYGNADISDQQVYRQVAILNRDYRKLNADTTQIVPEFTAIAADAKIQFRLATRDPYGNPTNGIVRRFTHETNIGDNFSKLYQWPRNRYLNVWVVASISSGAAGYSQYPTNVQGDRRWTDGVMILDSYIADIGTGSAYRSRALTHEIGHYLGLPHVWGSTNSAASICGDDGLPDTPVTQGYKNCPLDFPASYPANAMICDHSILENFQNYMDYSYCSVMFTEDQVSYMRNALAADVSGRKYMVSQKNRNESIPNGVIFDPVADFFTQNNDLISVVGRAVTFENFSWALVTNSTSYTWSFEDGTTSDIHAENPTVTFNSLGWKDVTLTVKDNGRSNTVTKNDFIWISPDWSNFSGNVHFDFSSNPWAWIIQNPENNEYEWEITDNIGKNGGVGIFLDMTNPYKNPPKFSPGFFFDSRRGGSRSAFISRPINLAHSTNINVSFDYACATDATVIGEMNEELEIYISRNYGKTWLFKKGISGVDLVNNGTGWGSFQAGKDAVWTNISFPLIDNPSTHLLLKFVYIGSDNSNNIAIDNIVIDGVLGLNAQGKADLLKVYPNPSDAATGWNINYDVSEWGGATFTVFDISGRKVTQGSLPQGQSKTNIQLNAEATQGIYILKIHQQDRVIQKKLVLQ